MIVFKNYFKIAKKYLSTIIMYTGIFALITVIVTFTGNEGTSFSSVKPKVTIVNNDNKSVLLDTFIKYIDENTVIKDVQQDEKSLKDALFYREVDAVLVIPENFMQDLTNGKDVQIETMKIPDSYNFEYITMLLNKFLNITTIYSKTSMDDKMIADKIIDDLNTDVNVTLIGDNQNELTNANFFYNSSNYTLLATSILVIATIMSSFNNTHVKKRNLVSKHSYRSINFQLFLGNVCICFFIWIAYVLLSIFMYKNVILSGTGLMLILNSLVFMFVTLSIGFLIGNLVRNKEAQNGIANVISLGSSFLCGAFVPQEILGNTVLSVAKFMPSYWFIKNNNDIVLLSNFEFTNLKPILINMAIMLGFGIIFFTVTNIVSRFTIKKN